MLALKTKFLLKVLEKNTSTFPECSKISLYCGLNDLRCKSIEELTELRQAGLTMAYTGLESGDRVTLEQIKKGLTPEQAEKGMAKAKAAGIEILVSIIFGIGGKERSRKHIVETTRLLNLMEPKQIAPMALAIQPGTELENQVETGCTPVHHHGRRQHKFFISIKKHKYGKMISIITRSYHTIPQTADSCD